MNIRAVIFDLDNVLYEEAEYFGAVFSAAMPRLAAQCHRTETEALEQLKMFFRTRGYTAPGVFADALRELGIQSGVEADFLFDLYSSIGTVLHPYPDVMETLRWLEGHGVQRGIVTNGTVAAQRNKVKSLGFAHQFNAIMYARTLGKENEKPSPLPFDRILNELGVGGRAALYVGDNPRVDFPGAQAMGMRTVRLNRGEFRGQMLGPEWGADFTIETHGELIRMVEDCWHHEAIY